MARAISTASPLSILEREAYRQKNEKNNNSNSKVGVNKGRMNMASSFTNDSVSKTGSLLDKLQLADNEWEDSDDSFTNSSLNDANTTNNSAITNYSNNDSTNSIPISKFKYLKSVLGSTKMKTSQKSAVNKALEMGKKINTVEQNASRVINRSDVQSIHLANVIHDVESSISLYETDDEADDDIEDGVPNEGGSGENVYAEFYAGNAEIDHGPVCGDAKPKFSESYLSPQVNSSGFNGDDGLIFAPQTPTKAHVDITPTGSPKTFNGQFTPQNSVNSTPKMAYTHNHSHSTISTGSVKVKYPPGGVLSNEPRDKLNITDSQGKPTISHNHTQSAGVDAFNDLSDLTTASVADDALLRTASLPIKRNKSLKHSPVPNQPLPLPPSLQPPIQPQTKNLIPVQNKLNSKLTSVLASPTSTSHLTQRESFKTSEEITPQHYYPNHGMRSNTTSQYSQHAKHPVNTQTYQKSQPQYSHYGPSSQYTQCNQYISKRALDSPSMQMYQNYGSPKQPISRQQTPQSPPPQQQYPYQHSTNNYPSPQRQVYPHYQQFNPQRTFNQPHKYAPNPHMQYAHNHQQHQPFQLDYPQQKNPYYKNKRQLYSPQTSPQIANARLVPTYEDTTLRLNRYDFESDTQNSPSSLPSGMKKKNVFQNIDLSHIIPR